MKILLTGASGLIGSALAPALSRDGHQVIRLSRGADRADSAQPSWDPDTGRISLETGGPFEAVIHLAGETVAQRWTPAAKERILNSRVKSTRLLSAALSRLPQPPEILISASATGYYGDRGDEWLDERSAPGAGFLAEVCRGWEEATRPASEHGIRVVNLRLGVVLAPQGGALEKMLPPFRFGFGGKLGHGRQFWSWITLDDVLAVFRTVLVNTALRGPVNVVSPQPVTNAEFTRVLGSVLRRPAFFTVPPFALSLALGEMGRAALLSSCRARPARLEEAGFAFRFPELREALGSVSGKLLARADTSNGVH